MGFRERWWVEPELAKVLKGSDLHFILLTNSIDFQKYMLFKPHILPFYPVEQSLYSC